MFNITIVVMYQLYMIPFFAVPIEYSLKMFISKFLLKDLLKIENLTNTSALKL